MLRALPRLEAGAPVGRALEDVLKVLTDSVGASVGASVVLATSLYDDPAAELHEDASARLRDHPALLGCSILRRSSPGVRR
jgi:hypothetical protein